MSTFQLLVKPVLNSMQGLQPVAGPGAECRVLHELKLDAERCHSWAYYNLLCLGIH